MAKQKIDKSIIITVIICITFLEAIALKIGYNGTILKIVLMILAGLAGLIIPTPKLFFGNTENLDKK